ncbi:MAG TPA: hypothetical protein VKB92_02235 [Myxococcales bacterium]|nr:hypothetical protein [Myxococcales bacterium]
MAQGKVACLPGSGFEDPEFRIPYDRLRKAERSAANGEVRQRV